MDNLPPKKFPLKPEDYKLYEEVGQGVSASVHRALCVPLNELVAIKVLDLEKCSSDLEVIRREVQTMTLLDHPNLLKAHCSFAAGTSLWIVTPYMDCGSCFHLMKYVHPTGFEQSIIATLLFGVLKALVYLHSEGLIHRDVKAGNILVDSKGSVKLADFGVSASLFDNGDRRHARNTFVGTPCWMAPEVMQQLHGYDFKADIWSFGITALELAHGHAPFSNYPPMKVLLMTIQNAPPGLDYERDKKFSKSFKEIVATCLVKDPKKRPTAEKLLKHRFFKYAHSRDYVAHMILDGLPPLGDRFRMLKEKESELLAQNKPVLDEEQLSQQEYIRGISAWNFNLDDMKKQAALIDDDADIISNPENYDWGWKQKGEFDDSVLQEKLVEISIHSDSENPVKFLQSGCTDLGGQDGSTPSPTLSSRALNGQLVHPVECDNGELASGPANVNLRINLRREPNLESLDSTLMESRNGLVKDRLPKPENSMSVTASSILPSLQHLLQQNTVQRDQILKAIRCAQEVVDPVCRNHHTQISDGPDRERALESRLVTMEQYNERLVKELQKQKMESAKLEKKIKAICEKE